MLQPNELPLICLPTELSGEAAAKLIEFCYELAAALERHYCAQLLQHHQSESDECPRDVNPPPSDPRF